MRKILASLAAGSLVLPLSVVAGSATTASASTIPAATKSLAGESFALINGDNADPFFLTIWKGALAEAKKFGIHLVEQAPPTFDAPTQVSYLNDEIARKVNGIILSPDADEGFATVMATAKTDGIPIVLVNSDSTFNNNPDKIAAFTSSQILLGDLAAKAMGSILNGTGTVGVINSVAGSLGDEQRGSSFIATMKADYPKIKLLAEQYDLDDRATADSMATDEMEANPGLSGIYGVDSFTGQGVGAAIEAAHKTGKIKVVAIDAEPQEVTLLRSGVIQALIAQAPYNMGVGAVQDLVYDLTGDMGAIKALNVLPPQEVTPQNVNTPAIEKWVYASAP
ncbi:MAG: substrate-binding domain-containing protein [Acidimicrobiales bacterium]